MMEQPERERLRIDRDICRAVSAAEDGTLQEKDREKLNKVLAADGRARGVYLDFIALRVALLSIAGRAVRKDAEARAIELAYKLPSARVPNAGQESGVKPSSVARRFGGWVLAASLAGLAVYYGVWRGNDKREATKIAHGPIEPIASALSGVATVQLVSPDTAWTNPNESLAIGARLAAGQRLQLSSGQIELVYESGVRVEVIGPAGLKLQHEGLVLEGGGLMATVPEAGRGFTVETPTGRIVDLGTEFGVVVDDFGFSEVAVFKGKVEAYPGMGPKRPKGAPSMLELTEGDGLLWTDSTVERTQADARRFSAGRPAITQANPGGPGHRSLTTGPDAVAWQALGSTRQTPAGFVMKGSRQGLRPYLLSSDELDPSEGPIVVECEVVVEAESKNPSVAILTRSDEQRGVAAAPWTDVLATCVRCSFGASPAAGVGVLEAATKHEGRWEPVALSWQGYRRPAPGERYQLVMVDDGVNVSFSVSLAADPTVSKTVRCRSLFRGRDNFVAIEGPRDGSVTVEHIRVYQQESTAQEQGFVSVESRQDSAKRSGTSELSDLARLFPAGARCLIAETFDSELDASVWESLGSVSVAAGSAQLGESITNATIDTWRARPYLMTRRSFSPSEQPITLVGRIEFADNYLSGFGGSFAVMTRAGSPHRGGDGWEQSLLHHGVRANFWPSGLELDRSLELHAVPRAAPVRLLSNKGFEIDPKSRVYDFRVVDDGSAVKLTLIDSRMPERRAELTLPADRGNDLGSISGGRIAFEATWGCPIRLREVHLFQAASDQPTSEAADR